jgi:microcystin degradation protein MlrC
LESFVQPTNWPGMTEGPAIVETFHNLNISISGFISEARDLDFAIVPLLWANATPSGPVSRHAFDTIVDRIVEGIRKTEGLTAVYIDLHGAMIAEGHHDAEAEILRRVREVTADDLPVIVSLDLHANISHEMQVLSDALVVCRTYPHVDLAETGRRSARVMAKILEARRRPAYQGTVRRLWKADFLIPTQSQTTFLEPAKTLYARLTELERQYGLLDLSLAMGFGLSDTPIAGPAICSTGFDAAAAETALALLAENFEAAGPAFDQPVLSAKEAIARARLSYKAGWPVILADLQDNPGAGGTGDTTGLLAALAQAGSRRSVLAVLYDPAAAAAAHEAGQGATLQLSLGGHVGGPGSKPFDAIVTVERLGSGQFVGTGPMYGGGPMYFGPMALLRLAEGPLVLVGSVNTQAADVAILQHVGIDPKEMEIIALKSGVHFRAAFQPLASEVLVVEEDGCNPASYQDLPYRNIRPEMRLMPVG